MSYFYNDPHEHPDAVNIKVAGKEVPWLITKKAVEMGQERGIDFDELGALDEEMTGSEALDAIIDMLMLGRLAFIKAGHDRPNRTDFEEAIAPNTIPKILGQINAAFAGVEDGEIADEVKKAMEEAAGQSSTSTPSSGSGTDTAMD